MKNSIIYIQELSSILMDCILTWDSRAILAETYSGNGHVQNHFRSDTFQRSESFVITNSTQVNLGPSDASALWSQTYE
jgi:hypothetical protein